MKSKVKVTAKMIAAHEYKMQQIQAVKQQEELKRQEIIKSQPVEVLARWKRNLKRVEIEIQEEGLTEGETFLIQQEINELKQKIQIWESENLAN